MIHIRSFFDLPPEAGRKGKAFSIANSTPNRVKVAGTIECLVPPWSLVRDFKAQKRDWEGYTDHYREYLDNVIFQGRAVAACANATFWNAFDYPSAR